KGRKLLLARLGLNASPHAYEERETNQEPKKTGKHKDFPRFKLSHYPRSLVATFTALPFISEIPFPRLKLSRCPRSFPATLAAFTFYLGNPFETRSVPTSLIATLAILPSISESRSSIPRFLISYSTPIPISNPFSRTDGLMVKNNTMPFTGDLTRSKVSPNKSPTVPICSPSFTKSPGATFGYQTPVHFV